MPEIECGEHLHGCFITPADYCFMTPADYYERAFPGEFWIELPGSSQDIIKRIVETCEDGFEADKNTLELLKKIAKLKARIKELETLLQRCQGSKHPRSERS